MSDVSCEPRGTGWCIDKRINVGTLVSIVSCLTVAIALFVSLQMRVEVVEDKLGRMESSIEQYRQTDIKVERIEERVQGIQQVLREIRDELRALRDG